MCFVRPVHLARRFPGLSGLNVRFLACVICRNPARYIDTMKFKVHEADRVILARPETRDMLVDDFTEALRGGAEGMVSDMSANHGRPWGFPLDEIKTKVLFWFGALDRSVPPAMGRCLSDRVPDSEAILVPDAGHLWILEHLDEVLNAAIDDRQTLTQQEIPR